VNDQFHTPATLPPGKETVVPTGPWSQYGCDGEEKKFHPLPEIKTRLSSPQPNYCTEILITLK